MDPVAILSHEELSRDEPMGRLVEGVDLVAVLDVSDVAARRLRRRSGLLWSMPAPRCAAGRWSYGGRAPRLHPPWLDI